MTFKNIKFGNKIERFWFRGTYFEEWLEFGVWEGCGFPSFPALDLSGLQENAILVNTFRYCDNLECIPNINFGNAEKFEYTFADTPALKRIELKGLPKAKYLCATFKNSGLEEWPEDFDTSSVLWFIGPWDGTKIRHMPTVRTDSATKLGIFHGMQELESYDGFTNLDNVTSLYAKYAHVFPAMYDASFAKAARALKVVNTQFPNCTNYYQAFMYADSLESVADIELCGKTDFTDAFRHQDGDGVTLAMPRIIQNNYNMTTDGMFAYNRNIEDALDIDYSLIDSAAGMYSNSSIKNVSILSNQNDCMQDAIFRYFLNRCYNIEHDDELDLRWLKNAKEVHYLLYFASKIKTVRVDFSNTENMRGALAVNAEHVLIENDTANVTDFSYCFYQNSSCDLICINQINTTNAETTEWMFGDDAFYPNLERPTEQEIDEIMNKTNWVNDDACPPQT
jgi:hypothetical protein